MAARSMTGSPDAEPSIPTTADRPRVVYVMGAGRSGSTILGVALGNCADIFYVGELDKWLLMSGISMREREVSKPGASQPMEIWPAVREDLEGAADLFGREARRCIEHSSAVLRVDKISARRRLRPRYRRVTAALYGSIARRAGSRYIVDSSHFPLRARELQALEGIELYLLYLVRDPRSVVSSWSRPGLPEPRFSMLTTNAYLWLTHVLSVFVFLRQPRARRLFVRYEDLVADPARVLQEILDMIESDASMPQLQALSTGAPYHGNRLILSPTVALVPQAPARPRASPITSFLQFPWRLIHSRLRPASGV